MNLCPNCLATYEGPLDKHKCATPETKPVNKDLSKQIPKPHSPQGDIEHK